MAAVCGVALLSIGSARLLRAQDGSITGRVTTMVPGSSEPLVVTTNVGVCGQTVPDESILVDATGGLENAVVTVGGLAARPETLPILVSNDECRFQPRVQVSHPGGEIELTSEDDVLHTSHAYAEDGRSLFNVAIPMPGLTITRQLTARGLVRLVCDTHTWMRGFVMASLDRAVVSAETGSFRIEGVPPGTYEVRVWHEKLQSTAQAISVTAGGVTEVLIEMKLPGKVKS
jgi:plastocyanin